MLYNHGMFLYLPIISSYLIECLELQYHISICACFSSDTRSVTDIFRQAVCFSSQRKNDLNY